MRKNWKKLKQCSAVALAVCSLGLGACMNEKKIASAEISKNYQRNITVQTEKTNPQFASAINDFSFALFQSTLQKKSNLLLSPLSSYFCLSMIANGANGETLKQLDTALCLPLQERNEAIYAYLSSLPSSKDARVAIANSIWLKENAIQAKESFLQTNANYFSAQVYASPFDQTTVEDINHWCYNHTQGKIDKILDQIPFDALAYLINTIDFDCKWENPYQKSNIYQGVFSNYDDSKTEKNFLHSNESTCIVLDNAVGFTRPYKDGNYSFLALLPDENEDVYTFASTLNGETWQTIWENRTHRSVKAQIPEFDYASEFTLNESLQSLGITDLFSPTHADLSNLSNQRTFLSQIKQKVKIEVNQNGTKAAAVTWGEMKATSAAPVEDIHIILNRPFVYAIVDNTTSVPLFLGLVHQL